METQLCLKICTIFQPKLKAFPCFYRVPLSSDIQTDNRDYLFIYRCMNITQYTYPLRIHTSDIQTENRDYLFIYRCMNSTQYTYPLRIHTSDIQTDNRDYLFIYRCMNTTQYNYPLRIHTSCIRIYIINYRLIFDLTSNSCFISCIFSSKISHKNKTKMSQIYHFSPWIKKMEMF